MGTTASATTSHAPLPFAGGGAPAFDVAVIGGGASGLAAAITAARAGASVCVIERDVEPGLGLLATGNGRCNISNSRLDARRFLHADAAREMFGTDGSERIESFFESLGLMLAEEDEGRLYPLTKRAETVRDVFLGACARLGIELIPCAEVRRARQGDADGSPAWELVLSVPSRPLSCKRGRDHKASIRNARKALATAQMAEREIRAAGVVVAVGGRSGSICDVFCLPHLDEVPVLCPIACAPAVPSGANGPGGRPLEALDGLRVEGMLTLTRGGAAIAFEQGEVLFRPYGISGIAAFNLSRRIEAGDVIELDLFPTMSEPALLELLLKRRKALGPFTGEPAWFDGMLAKPLAAIVCRALTGIEDPLARAASLLHRLPLAVAGTTEHIQAHVHRGGIPLSSIDLRTCAVLDDTGRHARRGLFACGEALDMDADCGGFNLAWAWMSGMRAGANCAKGRPC